MTMTASQALRAPRLPERVGSRAAGSLDPDGSPLDPHGWVRMGQRLAVALIGSLVALGTRPVEALGGIDGAPEDDDPAGNHPDRTAATAA